VAADEGWKKLLLDPLAARQATLVQLKETRENLDMIPEWTNQVATGRAAD